MTPCRNAHGPVIQSSAPHEVVGSIPLARWVSRTMASASAMILGRSRSSIETFSANGSTTHSPACTLRSATIASSVVWSVVVSRVMGSSGVAGST